ncbi:MAG: hypothetical protein WD651_13185 [Acidimicrobiia bacterium]|jgi:hypothetical protein
MVSQLLRIVVQEPNQDIAFARRAAVYLDRQGLDEQAIVQCLMDEFELDQATAEAVASLAA